MRLEFRPREPGRLELGIIYGLITLFVLGIARFFPLLEIAPDCAFRALTGFPCPTCGSTRSIVLLSHGRILSALAMNPLLFVVVAAAIVALVYGIFAVMFHIPRMTFSLSPREKNVMRAAVVVVLLAEWFYLIQVL